MAASAFRVLDAFSRAVTCIDAKRTSMLIHTAIKNGNIPPVRVVAGLPGAMSGWGATCTSRGLPGVVGTSRRSGVARWKAMISAVIVVYFYWTKSVGSAIGGHVSVSVGQRRILAHSGTVPGPIGTCHGTNQRICNIHDSTKRSCAWLRP